MTTTQSFTLHKMAFTLLAIGAFCLGLSATADAKPYRHEHAPGVAKTYKGKALEGKRNGKRGKGHRMARMMKRFDKFDVNNDGRLGWREINAAPTRFQKRLTAANANRDFFITRAEFRAHCAKHNGKGWSKDKTKRGKGNGKRRGKGAVIRDHRTGTVTPLLPSRLVERVPSRRNLHTR